MDFKNMDFSSVDKKYRPMTFWFLNDELNEETTTSHVRMMDEAHIGGFYLHARGGLETEYMGKEWFLNINAAIDEAKKRGMTPFAYDENGWPSGFADGAVPALGDDYVLKALVSAPCGQAEGKVILSKDGYDYFVKINPYYVDLLNSRTTDKFIEFAYEPYIEKAPETEGFFTDEPQLTRNFGIPWSDILPEEYEKEYAEDIMKIIPLLFYDGDGAECARIKYWRLITKLFSQNFAKRISEFTEKHKKGFTGHFLLEEPLRAQITSNGAVMPSYRYFDIPGMDCLTLVKEPGWSITAPYQVASVAHQTGRGTVVSESFAACGHGASFDDLRAVFLWQAVRGVTLLCLHGTPYSMRGFRKREYPPAIGASQPWWKCFPVFADTVGRIGAFLSEGKTEFDTLVLHPMTKCWASYNVTDEDKIAHIQGGFLAEIMKLEEKHILFDWGDEVIMEEDAFVENGKIVIGECAYSHVLVPFDKYLLPSTRRLLDEFEKSGGKIYTSAEDMEENAVISEPSVTYTRRRFENFDFHFFVNSHPEEKKCTVSCGAKTVNLETGEILPFDGNAIIPPFGCLAVIDDGENAELNAETKELIPLDLSGEWTVVESSDNALTMDVCRVDGESEPEYVLTAFTHAVDKRESESRLHFSFNLECVPERIFLGAETPEKFKISLNGVAIEGDDGEFFDPSVRLFNIKNCAKIGENTVTVEGNLSQSEEFYEKMHRAEIFESEKNNLKYDTELEALYLVGSFGVYAENWEEKTDKIHAASGRFTVGEAKKTVILSELEKQGFLFFAGSLKVKKTITVSGTDRKLKLDLKGVTAVNACINCKKLRTIAYAPFEADISEYLKEGENEIELEIVNSLRNLLGPHHVKDFKEKCTAPDSFHEVKNPFLPWDTERTKEYNIRVTGLI